MERGIDSLTKNTFFEKNAFGQRIIYKIGVYDNICLRTENSVYLSKDKLPIDCVDFYDGSYRFDDSDAYLYNFLVFL